GDWKPNQMPALLLIEHPGEVPVRTQIGDEHPGLDLFGRVTNHCLSTREVALGEVDHRLVLEYLEICWGERQPLVAHPQRLRVMAQPQQRPGEAARGVHRARVNRLRLLEMLQ